MPHEPTSQATGKLEDNASKAPQTHNHNDRGSDKPHSTLPLPQNHGTTNQSQWTSIEQGPPWETGEAKVKDSHEGMLQGQMTSEPKGGYKVHALIADSRDTLLMIAPPDRSKPICEWPSL